MRFVMSMRCVRQPIDITWSEQCGIRFGAQKSALWRSIASPARSLAKLQIIHRCVALILRGGELLHLPKVRDSGVALASFANINVVVMASAGRIPNGGVDLQRFKRLALLAPSATHWIEQHVLRSAKPTGVSERTIAVGLVAP